MTTEQLLTEILTELRALRTLLTQQPTDIAPNYQRSINEYPTFDWSIIDAEVVAHDRNGATEVTWHGMEFKRRRHTDYNNAVWFSRYTGKTDENGKRVYARLITFSDTKSPVKRLPEEITDLLPESKLPPKPTPSTLSTRRTIDPQLAYWNLVKQHKPILTPDILNALANVANTQGYQAAYDNLQSIIAALSTPSTASGDAPAPVLEAANDDPLDNLLSADELDAFFS